MEKIIDSDDPVVVALMEKIGREAAKDPTLSLEILISGGRAKLTRCPKRREDVFESSRFQKIGDKVLVQKVLDRFKSRK